VDDVGLTVGLTDGLEEGMNIGDSDGKGERRLDGNEEGAPVEGLYDGLE